MYDTENKIKPITIRNIDSNISKIIVTSAKEVVRLREISLPAPDEEIFVFDFNRRTLTINLDTDDKKYRPIIANIREKVERYSGTNLKVSFGFQDDYPVSAKQEEVVSEENRLLLFVRRDNQPEITKLPDICRSPAVHISVNNPNDFKGFYEDSGYLSLFGSHSNSTDGNSGYKQLASISGAYIHLVFFRRSSVITRELDDNSADDIPNKRIATLLGTLGVEKNRAYEGATWNACEQRKIDKHEHLFYGDLPPNTVVINIPETYKLLLDMIMSTTKTAEDVLSEVQNLQWVNIQENIQQEQPQQAVFSSVKKRKEPPTQPQPHIQPLSVTAMAAAATSPPLQQQQQQRHHHTPPSWLTSPTSQQQQQQMAVAATAAVVAPQQQQQQVLEEESESTNPDLQAAGHSSTFKK